MGLYSSIVDIPTPTTTTASGTSTVALSIRTHINPLLPSSGDSIDSESWDIDVRAILGQTTHGFLLWFRCFIRVAEHHLVTATMQDDHKAWQ